MSTKLPKLHLDGDDEAKVHFHGAPGSPSDSTLCGATLDGDEMLTVSLEYVDEPVDCKTCLSIVKYCKSLKIPKKEHPNAR